MCGALTEQMALQKAQQNILFAPGVMGHLHADEPHQRIAPTQNSSGLQITVKQPGQGYRFLWALIP